MSSRLRQERSFTARERELLHAARQERMPTALSQSIRAALDQQLTAAPVRTRPLGAAHALRLKMALWGAIGVVMIGGLARLDWRGERVSPPLAANASLPRSAASDGSEPDSLPLSAARSTSGTASSSVLPASAEATLAAGSPPQARLAAPAPDPLRLELQLLEGVRAALARRASSEAARLLDRYERSFERGTLHPESEALRVELHVMLGQPELARRDAARFLVRHPDHPLRERVRQLTRAQLR